MGLQFLSFHDTTRVLSPSISLSKYTGQFLTIGRFNMGLKNLSAPWNFYGGLQQRYYHSDQSYSAFSIGYGYDPDLTIFFNGIDLTEIRNKTFNLGLQTTQMLNSTWQMQLRGELQWLQFGTDRRKQANYFIKLFYYW
ncbi:MAG: hypothetical protein KDC53_06995, partial [Saprospiraceae bacterium]|nr:hypothetical protein [Saprospiraceae bacterium]